MSDDLAITLSGIRDAAGNENTASVLYGLERMIRKSGDWEGWVGEEYETVAKVLADLGRLRDAAPLLLAALEAVLKLADDLDAEAAGSLLEEINEVQRECAARIRDTALAALLTGEKASDE